MPILNVVKGDLISMFLDPENREINSFAHGANCIKVMGSGIAAGVRERINPLAQADWDCTLSPIERLGHYTMEMIHIGQDKNKKLKVGYGFNLYTQLHPAKSVHEVAVDYWALGLAFKKVNRYVRDCLPQDKREVYKKFGIPMIGAGLANGDWATIERIINDVTPDLEITLVEYQPKP